MNNDISNIQQTDYKPQYEINESLRLSRKLDFANLMSPTKEKEKETFDYVPKEKVEVMISKDERAFIEISANDKPDKLIKQLE